MPDHGWRRHVSSGEGTTSLFFPDEYELCRRDVIETCSREGGREEGAKG